MIFTALGGNTNETDTDAGIQTLDSAGTLIRQGLVSKGMLHGHLDYASAVFAGNSLQSSPVISSQSSPLSEVGVLCFSRR